MSVFRCRDCVGQGVSNYFCRIAVVESTPHSILAASIIKGSRAKVGVDTTSLAK